jgi:hypothetical protein
MRQPNIRSRWIALLFAAILVILVVPGVTQAKTSSGPQIHLQYASFDPLSGEPYVPSAQRMSITAVDSATYLLQFSGPVREEWKAAVTQAGVRLFDYVPDYAFIAQMDAAAAAKVQDMSYVRWVGLYQPAYRLSPALKETRLSTSISEPVLLNVQTLPDVDLAGITDQVKVLGGAVVSSSTDATSGYLRLFMPAGQIDALAAQEGVLWVEPYVEPVMSNDVGGASIMEATTIRASAGLYGSGQIVGVSDSGLDVGVTGGSMSDDFEGRIVAGQAMCATHYVSPLDMRTTWSDLHAHGTHVSGSVLGSGVLSGSNPGVHIYDSTYAGVAPEAKIVFQSLDSDGDGGLECIPAELSSSLFGPAYNLGARIHTNSWGGPSGDSGNPYGVYTLQARQVDSAAWNFNDMLILYAAGNDGADSNRDGLVDPDSIGSPGTAKNALTIGASENERPSIDTAWGDGWILDFPVNPIRDDLTADNRSGMAGFSSRGPTDDGRIKPDLAAPGTYIISARSHDPSPTVTEGWGEVNQHYLYMGGTSMATPLTAGAATLVREWLTTVKGITAPSAALMKAVMVNGAVDMSPGQYSSPQEIPSQRPNNVSGWGRVSLVGSIAPPAPLTVYLEDNTSGLTTGSSITYTLNVGGASTSSGFEKVGAVESVPVVLSLEGTPEPESEVTPEPPAREDDSASHPDELLLDSGYADPEDQSDVIEPQSIEADVSLVLDDGQWDISRGLVSQDPPASYQFIWLNRFTPGTSEYPFTLDQVWVMFDDNDGGNNVSPGQAIDLVVYEDADGNPANGATFRGTYSTSILAADGTNWSKYNLVPGVTFTGPGDVLIAVINRYVDDGVTPQSLPALKDTNTDKGRSWIGYWNSTPPDPALLPPYPYFQLDGGNWMIRGYGETGGTVPPTPTDPPPPTEPPPTQPSPSGNPLRVTLAWTDYPGSLSAAKALVNDLDLEVIAPNGTHYYGNGGTYTAGSSCLRNGVWDACNNLEGVIIPGAEYGVYTIVVHGANVPSGPQPFALAAAGDALAGDAIAPAKITDLAAATGSSSGAVDLTWTATGDDAKEGTATSYSIRYNKSPITAANWSSSTRVGDVPVPDPSGDPETLTVYGLTPGDTYYFAIKTLDEVPNVSEVSNSPGASSSTAPDIVPPDAITDLSANRGVEIGEVLLSWTAPGDDETTGTATAYAVGYYTATITSANWVTATNWFTTTFGTAPSPNPAGTHETLMLFGVPQKVRYYFAVKAQDEVPNIAGLSNVSDTFAEDKLKIFLPLTQRR